MRARTRASVRLWLRHANTRPRYAAGCESEWQGVWEVVGMVSDGVGTGLTLQRLWLCSSLPAGLILQTAMEYCDHTTASMLDGMLGSCYSYHIVVGRGPS